jgi:hypothetical protein
MTNKVIEEHEWEACGTLVRSLMTEQGKPYRARAPGVRGTRKNRRSDARKGEDERVVYKVKGAR